MTDDATTAAAATDTLGYEQARDELIEVVRRLEAGGTTLEESLALWERGEELAKVCLAAGWKGPGPAWTRPSPSPGRTSRTTPGDSRTVGIRGEPVRPGMDASARRL